MRYLLGVFFILHGLVHMLYYAQSRRLFELQPGMIWPEGSWALSGLFGAEATKLVASLACVVASLSFAASGTALLFGQSWWRPTIIGAAAFSALFFILLWNGRIQMLAEQGAIGILIDAAILASVLIIQWPEFGFS